MYFERCTQIFDVTGGHIVPSPEQIGLNTKQFIKRTLLEEAGAVPVCLPSLTYGLCRGGNRKLKGAFCRHLHPRVIILILLTYSYSDDITVFSCPGQLNR